MMLDSCMLGAARLGEKLVGLHQELGNPDANVFFVVYDGERYRLCACGHWLWEQCPPCCNCSH